MGSQLAIIIIQIIQQILLIEFGHLIEVYPRLLHFISFHSLQGLHHNVFTISVFVITSVFNLFRKGNKGLSVIEYGFGWILVIIIM
jgi:hypothetical protein